MSLKTLLAATAALSLAAPAFADIEIKDAYARAAMPNAKAGAAFMQIVNTGAEDDRLVAASSGIAKKTELHTHVGDANGVMKMVHVEEGFPIPAGSTLKLADLEGPGIINHCWFTLRGEDPNYLSNIILKIKWDDAPEPAVDAPWGPFFGLGHNECADVVSAPIARGSGCSVNRKLL